MLHLVKIQSNMSSESVLMQICDITGVVHLLETIIS